MLGKIVRYLCGALATKLPLRVITDENGDPYLNRYYLCGKHPAYFPTKVKTFFDFLPTIFLHQFVRDDADKELHNHPWDNALSFILVGGYIEERRRPTTQLPRDTHDPQYWFLTRRFVWPGTFNRIKANDFHRVELMAEDAWTIFITGNKAPGSWGFWNPYDGAFMKAKDFFAMKANRRHGR